MEERERKWESEKRKRVGRKRKRVQIYRTGKVKQGKTVDGRYNNAHLTITFSCFFSLTSLIRLVGFPAHQTNHNKFDNQMLSFIVPDSCHSHTGAFSCLCNTQYTVLFPGIVT